MTGEPTFLLKPLSGITAASRAISALRKEDKAIVKQLLIKRNLFALELFKAWVIVPILFKESVYSIVKLLLLTS